MLQPRILLKGGTVVTMNSQQQVHRPADLLITGKHITAIGPDLQVDDCEVIDASGMIVMPGFVDTHRHVWESVLRGVAGDYSLMEYLQQVLGPPAAAFRADDVYTANLLGSLEALDAGITTLLDWSHIMNSPEHGDAAIAGLQQAGIRAVFAHGTPGTSVWEWFYESRLEHPADIERLCRQYFSSPDQLVTPAMAIRGPEYSAWDVAVHDLSMARRLALPVTMHAGCGTFAAKYNAVQKLAAAGLLGPDLNFAHGNFFTPEDFRSLGDHGCSISVTPEVEMQMGLGFPATGNAMAAGMRPALGIDVVTGAGGDMFTQMRFALQTERARVNQEMLLAGEMPQRLSLTMSDALQWATINGARALGLEKKTGSLEPGKEADIILLKTAALNMSPVGNPVAAIVSQAGTANIEAVFVAGRAVKRHGKLLHPDLAGLRSKAAKTASYLYEGAVVSSMAAV